MLNADHLVSLNSETTETANHQQSDTGDFFHFFFSKKKVQHVGEIFSFEKINNTLNKCNGFSANCLATSQ